MNSWNMTLVLTSSGDVQSLPEHYFYISHTQPVQGLGYGLDDWGSIPKRGRDFLSSQSYPVHPASYPLGTRGFFPGSKVAGA